jgi:hypothetical protein
MTIQRRNCTRRLQFEPLEARDVPSVMSPHAGLLRPMARAEVHREVQRHVQAARVHAPAAVAASTTASAGAVSSSMPPPAASPDPIIVVLGPTLQMVVTPDPDAWISPPFPAAAQVLSASNSST